MLVSAKRKKLRKSPQKFNMLPSSCWRRDGRGITYCSTAPVCCCCCLRVSWLSLHYAGAALLICLVSTVLFWSQYTRCVYYCSHCHLLVLRPVSCQLQIRSSKQIRHQQLDHNRCMLRNLSLIELIECPNIGSRTRSGFILFRRRSPSKKPPMCGIACRNFGKG